MIALKQVLTIILLTTLTTASIAQTILLQESFETDGFPSRYIANQGITAENDIWSRTNLNPAPYHADVIGTGTRDGSWYWAGEDVMTVTGGVGLVRLKPVSVAGFSSLDVQVAIGISRAGQDRWENDDFVQVEYNMDNSGWNIIGLFTGDNPANGVPGRLKRDNDNNLATFGPFGAEVSGTFVDYTFSIPVTGNDVEVRVRNNSSGSEELGFDNIRVRGIASNNDAPVLANIEGGSLPYSEGDAAIQVSNTINGSDADDTNLTNATVRLTTNFDNSEDVLAFTASGGISGSYNSVSGVLSLSGNSSVANYQAVLQSVTYLNTDVVDASAATRTISFQVNDGTDNSNFQTRDIIIATSLNTIPAALPYVESFETDGEGARYGSNHFISGCFFAERGAAGTDAGGCFLEVLTGADGDFVFNTESTATNGGFVLTSQPLDISTIGASNFMMEILIAVSRDDETRWETDDQIRIEYSIDGGAYEIAGLFTGSNPGGIGTSDLFEDLDQDPATLGPFAPNAVPDVFTSYSLSFTGEGSTMTYRIVIDSDGTEELAFDRIALEQTILPVEWVDFTATKHGRSASLLQWTTAVEIDNEGFYIERRMSDSQWEEIGFMAGKGNSSINTDYTYLDQNPLQRINYYRLKQIDFNGEYEYSKIVSLTHQKEEVTVHIFPNPANEIAIIEIARLQNSRVKITVYDVTGRPVYQAWKEEGIIRIQLDIRDVNFSPGSYIVQIEGRNINFSKRLQVIK